MGPTGAGNPRFDTRRFKYCARYCEENVWHACQVPELAQFERKIVIISNEQQGCALWHQRAAPRPGVPMCWDYHVVLLVRAEEWLVVDLDSVLGAPVPVRTYLDETFRPLSPAFAEYAPLFRVLEATDYIVGFNSDRSHMRDRRGRWLAPPPPWPPILGVGLPPLLSLTDFRSDEQFGCNTLGQMRNIFCDTER